MSMGGDLPEPTSRRRVVVGGRVQGVSFRDGLRREAEQGDVSGWVRNAPDSTVEAELEGSSDAVSTLVDWMRHGPEHARVDHLTETDMPTSGETGFRIR